MSTRTNTRHDKGIGKVLSNIHVTKHITQFIFGRASCWMGGGDEGDGIGDVAFFQFHSSLSLCHITLKLSQFYSIQCYDAMMIWCRVLFSPQLWVVGEYRRY